ncbi:hypothetical protein [Kitasatospora kifunensis]|uniref:Uncharacterized protein n=1 Tax=Kitasatospora kifunensis TaxID=58351 RepID=A0A7W7QYR1_KITKI|nr:hypothetical protein [Kitasatospora kifunensis]MBB4922262.1 hypothetical protein [Kitasatospora kifunensis]
MPVSRANKIAINARRAKLVEYRRKKIPYSQFYEELGYSSVNEATKDFKRTLEESIARQDGSVELYREEQLQELEYLAEEAHKILREVHYVVATSGKVALDPNTDQPLIDHAPKLQAIDRLLRILDRVAKLRGTEQIRVEVLTIDAIDAEIQRLSRDLAALGDEAGEAPPVEAADC